MESLEYCQRLLEKAKTRGVQIHLPQDNVIADKFDPEAHKAVCQDGRIPEGWMGLDIGPKTIKEFSELIRSAGTVIWNGPMGVFEWPRFAFGTQDVYKRQPVDAPDGTMARPTVPSSRVTSHSTVGLPRESSTWRA